MKNILIILSHPDMTKSRINKSLIQGIQGKNDLIISDLYGKYSDFKIDVAAEQKLMINADVIIFQYPFYWYNCPPLLKEWMDKVLLPGFAYGQDGNKLSGKILFSAVSADGSCDGYQSNGYNLYTIKELLRPIELTAKYCKMHYRDPFVVYNTDNITDEALGNLVSEYSNLIDSLLKTVTSAAVVKS